MERFLSIFMSCVFALAFAQAPFAHVHEHSDPHDHGGVFHTHHVEDDHDHSDGVALKSIDPDNDARSVDVFKVVKSPDAKLLFTLPATLIGFAPELERELVQGVTPRGHDPPDLTSSPARAPPA